MNEIRHSVEPRFLALWTGCRIRRPDRVPSSSSSAPQRRRGWIHKTIDVAQAVSAILAEQKRSIEIDETCLLREQDGGRHRQ